MASTLPVEATLGDNQRGIPVGNKAYGTREKKTKKHKDQVGTKARGKADT